MKKILIALLLAIVLPCTSFATSKKPLTGKNILFLIAQKNFQDAEYSTTKLRLRKQGANIVTASTTLNTSKGMNSLPVKPDILITRANPNNYDAFVIIGGSGANEFWDNKPIHKLIRNFLKQGKVVAAICISPMTLAKAGVLKGKTATVWGSYANAIESMGAIYENAQVVRDGKIVTAKNPKAAKEFAAEITKAMVSN